jgi:dihydroorotate dehydrogenase
MNETVFRLVRPWLWALEPERAHWWAIRGLRLWGVLHDWRVANGVDEADLPQLAQQQFGIQFNSPVGMAAGFDKNAQAVDGILSLGAGFVEVGTVTPLPQPGNPGSRLFRLDEDDAIINRLGFNNSGQAKVLDRLVSRAHKGGIVGVNVGVNANTHDRVADYVEGLKAFHQVASYIAINISSPNTPGLRSFQSKAALETLVGRLMEARTALNSCVPLLLKIAPDIEAKELGDLADVCLAARIDGIIVSNTTISQPALRSRHAGEVGGLSGRPLFQLSTRKLAQLYRHVGGRIPLIGVGGIDSAEAAWQKIRAGACLVQLHTGFVFKGPSLFREINRGLAERIETHGFNSLSDAVGSGVAEWTDAAHNVLDEANPAASKLAYRTQVAAAS